MTLELDARWRPGSRIAVSDIRHGDPSGQRGSVHFSVRLGKSAHSDGAIAYVLLLEACMHSVSRVVDLPSRGSYVEETAPPIRQTQRTEAALAVFRTQEAYVDGSHTGVDRYDVEILHSETKP